METADKETVAQQGTEGPGSTVRGPWFRGPWLWGPNSLSLKPEWLRSECIVFWVWAANSFPTS